MKLTRSGPGSQDIGECKAAHDLHASLEEERLAVLDFLYAAVDNVSAQSAWMCPNSEKTSFCCQHDDQVLSRTRQHQQAAAPLAEHLHEMQRSGCYIHEQV